jgi:hypothetical protein
MLPPRGRSSASGVMPVDLSARRPDKLRRGGLLYNTPPDRVNKKYPQELPL